MKIKNKQVLKWMLCAMVMLPILSSCNKETYIESIGKVTLETGDESAVGHYIFTSGNAISTCEEFSIFVDDILIGKINQNNNENINCKTVPVQNKIVRAVASEGSHDIKIVFKNTCKPDLTATNTLEKGKCVWYKIP